MSFDYDDKYHIEKYYNLDEGFEAARPDLCLVENNPITAFHIAQLKYHREALIQWMEDNVEGDLDEEE